MLFLEGGFGLLLFGLWLFTLLDVITSEESLVRNIPKTLWFFLVLITFEVGVVLWFIAGRPQGQIADLPYKGNRGSRSQRDRWPSSQTAGFPEYEAPHAAANPDDDSAFQAQLRRRVEEQRQATRREPPPEPAAG